MRGGTWLIVGAVTVLLLAGGGTAVYVMTRGLRNNNPGNIRKSADKWLGLAAEQTDDEFFQFVSPEYGIRAMAVILRNYRNRYGLRTIRQIITRWAPPVENNTDAYIAAVSSKVGLGPDEMVFEADIPRLIDAIIAHENIVNPYTIATIEKGVALA